MDLFTPTHTHNTPIYSTFPSSTVSGIGGAKNRPLWQQYNTRAG